MSRVSIPSVYDEVRKAYAGMGYPVSGDRLVVSEQPTYVDGRPVPKDVLAPEVSGGNTQNDGTVRVNPDYRAVMRHWWIKGSGRDFLRTIIGHELGHHVDRTVLSGRAAERRRLLREIARSGFHTVYTDSYGPGTDRRKLDKELLAEYLAKQVSDRLGKKAEDAAYSTGLGKEAQLKAVGRLVGSLRGLFRHSPLWKARRVLSKVPRAKSKIRYAYPSVEAAIQRAPGTSRVYRGSGVEAMADLDRNGILSSPHGYDLHSKGLYGYQGWRGRYEDYWGSFPESVRQDILGQMRGKTLVTNTVDSAAQFYRGGDGKYIHVYDIPNGMYDNLRWTGDAGQQRGVLEYVRKALSEGRPFGKIPSPFGSALKPGKLGYETAVDRSLLRDAYAGSVHRLDSYSPLRDSTWGGDPLYRRGFTHENRLARIIGLQPTRYPRARLHPLDPRYDTYTYYRDQGDIRTFSPVDDTLERMKRLEASGWRQTWLDRLTELVSPTVQR